jgi:hypothetical protein
VIDSEITVEESNEIGGEAELNNLWETLQKSGEVEGELADYLAVDQELVTGGELTTDKLLQFAREKRLKKSMTVQQIELKLKSRICPPSLLEKPARHCGFSSDTTIELEIERSKSRAT